MDCMSTNSSDRYSLKNEKKSEADQNKNLENFNCSLCKLEHEKMISDPNSVNLTGRSINGQQHSENESKLYTISEYVFGLFCSSEKSEHKLHQEEVYNALSKIKECCKNSNIKLFCLAEVCPEMSKLCDTIVTFLVDFSKPPKLKSLLTFCESAFDWLAKANDNRILIYCQDSVSVLTLMVYVYSCYYDALLRRDIRQTVAMKSFISKNFKFLEKVPISYRRYGGYMSLYSCMNQLQSLRSSVYLYCIVLYSFPAMESDKTKTSQIFFKIYTNDPLICCHTTKLYCLPAAVNRLVILFDKYPISLHDDIMIVCYHRDISKSKRTKLFRLNFHSCQAISDMLTFHCQDFEDVYPACPLKMKLDLYFRETAVFGQGDSNYVCETSHSDLTVIERSDSYKYLDNLESYCKMGSSVTINSKPEVSMNIIDLTTTKEHSIKDSTSITVFKTVVEDHRDKQGIESAAPNQIKVINQSGRISGPIDSYHSTKLDTVRTSSSILNGSGSNNFEYKFNNMNYGNNSHQNLKSGNDDRDKCHQQLDTLMKDLNLEHTYSTAKSRMNSNGYMNNNDKYNDNSTQRDTTNTNNREIQLMTELLEAQKEISNLRRSMNHLDITDQSSRVFTNNAANNFSTGLKFKGIAKTSVSASIPDAYNYNTSRTRNWSKDQNESNQFIGHNSRTSPRLNSTQGSLFNVETNSINEFNDVRQISGYSAHRENMERDRLIKEKYMAAESSIHHSQQNERDISDVFEEIETINLQPIGKGIQDLTKGAPPIKMPIGTSRLQSNTHLFSENIGSLSPISMRQNFLSNRAETCSTTRLDIGSPIMGQNTSLQDHPHGLTLQMVEEKMQSWYQPQLSRDEAIAILRNCSSGNFLIRDSNTYSGAYGLAVKVATIPPNITLKSDDIEAEKVRHYLIELMGNQGVCFKGFPDEPIFPTLSHLVLYYTHVTSVLPCLLIMPEKRPMINDIVKPSKSTTNSQSILLSSPRLPLNKTSDINAAGYSVYYLGCYDVEYITGPSVVNKAVERLLENIDARRYTECQLRINPGEGIVLTDLERKLFFRRNHPFSTITYCATDPRERKIELEVCKSKGIKKTKIFGVIIKAYIAGENKCFLFGELDPTQKASVIVKLINEQIQKASEN